MYDKPRIAAGLAMFLVVILFPVWFSAAAGRIGARPELKLPDAAKDCVAPIEYMRKHHMELLSEWRDSAIRDGNREFVKVDGSVDGAKSYEKSLTKTCLGCHEDRKNFCDKCHDYLSVRPNCFDCHHDKAGG